MSTPDDLDRLEPRLRDLLHGVADGIESPHGDLDRVRHRGRRRRNAGRTLVAMFSVVALLAVGLVTSQLVGNRGDEGFTVSSPTPEATTAPASETDGTTDTSVDTVVDTGDGSAPTTVVAPTEVPGGWTTVDPGGHMVMWGDGVARVGIRYEAPTIGPLSDEVVAMFPPDVVEFFEGRLPSTVNEGLEMLEDRPDLLAEIQRVMAEHPEAAAAIQGGPSPTTLVVETSSDGQVWTPEGELELPEAMDYYSNVVSTGSRLVVVGQTWELNAEGSAPSGPSGAVIASTSDLRQWDSVQRIDTGSESALPAGFFRNEYVGGLDAGPGGVVLTISESLEPHIESLVPADVRAQLESGTGYSMATGPDGITIDIMGEGREVTVVGPDNTEQLVYEDGEILETYDFTWEELGVDATFANRGTQSVSVWMGDVVDGLVKAAPLPAGGWSSLSVATADGGAIVATSSDGPMVVWYTADGSSWVDRTPPLQVDAWPSALIGTADGVMLFAHVDGAVETWSADSSAQGWTQGDVPVFGDDEQGWVQMSAAGPAGTAVLFTVEQGAPGGWAEGDVLVERDGYRLILRISERSASADLLRVGVDGGPDELVHAWDDLNVRTEHTVEHSDGGLTFLDPDTGEELVTITGADLEQAYADAFGEPDSGMYDYTPPDHVLMWTADGTTWEQLDRIEPDAEFDPESGMGERWPSGLVVTENLVLLALEGGITGTEVRTYSP
jgi:hypothetical protein